MFPELAAGRLGRIGEGVVWPIHHGVLAEHGGHDCGEKLFVNANSRLSLLQAFLKGSVKSVVVWLGGGFG